MSSQYFLTLFFFLLLSCITITSSSASQNDNDDTLEFIRPINRNLLGINKKEKLSHLKFYWHDTLSGKNPSSINIIPSPSKLNSTTSFGLVNMFDNPLTLGPKLSSKLVGKSQGFYASAGKDEFDFLVAMNLAFTEGKYNGSSLTILGRNPIFDKVRELPVIGGSGLFRFARGYAKTNTIWGNAKTKDAVAEYNVYVFHY